MNTRVFPAIMVCFVVFQVSSLRATPNPDFHLYLCFGQSNMAGGCNGKTAATASIDNKAGDCDTMSRIKLLAWANCPNSEQPNTTSYACKNFTLNRTNNKWYTAFPPYNKCDEGIGPAVYFGKTLLDSVRENITIGLIHCAISGVGINVFMKGSGAAVPSGVGPPGLTSDAYGWMKNKCKIAQDSGIIKGIIFHQGENDASNPSNWISNVKKVFNDLKADLGLDDGIPIVVGEMLRGACCEGLNPKINQLAQEYPNCAVASSEGLQKRPGDTYNAHFDCAGMRELGRRFAKKYLGLADTVRVPRKITVAVSKPKELTVVSTTTVRSWTGETKVYSLDGRTIAVINGLNKSAAWSSIKPGKVYIASRKSSNTIRMFVLP